jgi:hypothetical protein
MPRTNQGGKPLRLVLQWLLNRESVPDTEIAEALHRTGNSFGTTRKEKDDFPNFDELNQIGHYFGISSVMLQIAFGHLGPEALGMLDPDAMRQYLEQGGQLPPEKPPPRRFGKRGQYELRDDVDPL